MAVAAMNSDAELSIAAAGSQLDEDRELFAIH
jgi:hypothetical protein